jgi:hypothetical protein
MRSFILKVMMIVALISGFLTMPAMAANANDQLFAACKNKANDSAICHDKSTKDNPVVRIIHVAADIIAVLTGVLAVVAIIVSGLQMIISSGNAETVKTARRRLVSAVVGLVVVALAWTIITFALDNLLA